MEGAFLMNEILAVAALLLFVVLVTGLLITGVVHVALAGGSTERRGEGSLRRWSFTQSSPVERTARAARPIA